MPEGNQVDEVVGMEVADQDRVERAGFDSTDETRERALTQVEKDRGRAAPDEIGRPGRVGPIRPRGACAQDRQLET